MARFHIPFAMIFNIFLEKEKKEKNISNGYEADGCRFALAIVYDFKLRCASPADIYNKTYEKLIIYFFFFYFQTRSLLRGCV